MLSKKIHYNYKVILQLSLYKSTLTEQIFLRIHFLASKKNFISRVLIFLNNKKRNNFQSAVRLLLFLPYMRKEIFAEFICANFGPIQIRKI